MKYRTIRYEQKSWPETSRLIQGAWNWQETGNGAKKLYLPKDENSQQQVAQTMV
jgi:hypothetical protein